MQFPNISIGRSTKRYTHNMSFDNNTTMPFGVVQPLMSQRLVSNSKISVNMRQLVRLAPMPVPTFARIFMNNEVSFVPTVDVCPYYEAFKSQLSFKGSISQSSYYPTRLPSTNNAFLLYSIFCSEDLCSWSCYNSSGKLFSILQDHEVSTFSQNILTDMFGKVPSSAPSLPYSSYCGQSSNFISPSSADFVFHYIGGSTVCFRLSSRGRRLRSVLIGLGYSLSITDVNFVSLIPLLSYYKAWFDLYYPVRQISWTDTNAYALIKLIEEYNWNFTSFATNFDAFISFYKDVSNTFFVAKDDILSVHRSSLSTFPSNPPSYIDYDGTSSSLTTDSGAMPYREDSFSLGLLTLQAIQRFSRYFNKNSVIGRRISKFLQVHYGESVASTLFKDSNHVHTFSFPLNIDDVFSTSDTFEASADTSKGDVLGSYAGKGLGFDKSHFDFTAPSDGYLFVMSSLSTPTGYFQGNSGDLYVTNFDTLPVPDFDALGFELSHRGQFISDNGICLPDYNVPLNPTSSFGFVPRYTGLKYHKNIVNGDISRRGTSSSLSAYHLNRILTPYTLDSSIDSSNGITAKIDVHYGTIPNADSSWRFLTAYDWLGNYDRIFYNTSSLYPNNLLEYNLPSDDNFIVQTVFDSYVTDQFKPLSQSFDTFEESTDNSSIDVNPE